MKALKELFDRIVRCVNINLRELDYDVHPFVKNLVPFDQLIKFYAFYGITPHHPLDFKFRYQYPLDKLSHYIHFATGKPPQGLFMEFVEKHKKAFQRVFETVNIDPSVTIPRNASLDRYAAIKPKTHISDNVLVAQRAFLQNAWLGVGANAQENCYIINSRLEGELKGLFPTIIIRP